MGSIFTFKKGIIDPSAASGLTLGEPAFNTVTKKFFIGLGTGITAAWVGATITGASADIQLGLTGSVPTASAVKNYITSLETIGDSSAAITIGSTAGTAHIRNPNLKLGNTTASILTSSGSTNDLTIQPNGSLILTGATAGGYLATNPKITISNTAQGYVTLEGGDLYLGLKGADVGNPDTSVNIIFEGASANAFETTLTVTDPTADRTITLPDATGTVALTSSVVTSFNGNVGAIQGVSAAVAGTGISVSGATGSVTITNIGVQSFNGATGAVTGASLGANTFTALNTFSAGISAANGVTFAKDIRVNSLTIGVGNDPLNHGVGTYNTAIGYQVLLNTNGDGELEEGVYNTAVGREVLKSNTTGSNNTGLGVYSLPSNTTGSYNTGLGVYSLFSNTTGSSNTGLGVQSLFSNTTGLNNTGLGVQSLPSNTTGSYNTGLGVYSLFSNTTGSQNTAIGYLAGAYRGTALTSLTTGTGGIYIGYQARGSTLGQTNEIVIGVDALGLGSNTAVIGATLQSAATIYGVLNLPSGLSASGATFSGNISAPNIVNSFNGVTGAVTGASLGANTFTALNTFSAGISASGATFTGSIVLQNLEKIQNTTNGRIDFQPGPTAGTAYGLYFDMTSWGYGVKIGTIDSSGTVDAGNLQFSENIILPAGKNLAFNSNQSYKMAVSENGLDTLQMGLFADAAYSNAFAIMDYAGMGVGARSPVTAHANPNLYIYRAGYANANNYIRFEHDGTNGNIVAGGTSGIKISGLLDVASGLSAAGATFTGNISAPNIVTSFNGLTGAVTGITAGGVNTFTALNTFSAGISASGATLSGTVITSEKVNAITSARTVTVNFQNGNIQTLTGLGSGATGSSAISFTGASATGSSTVTMIITNGGLMTSNTTFWSTAVKWPGEFKTTLSTSGVDILTFTTIDAGTNIYGMLGGKAFS